MADEGEALEDHEEDVVAEEAEEARTTPAKEATPSGADTASETTTGSQSVSTKITRNQGEMVMEVEIQETLRNETELATTAASMGISSPSVGSDRQDCLGEAEATEEITAEEDPARAMDTRVETRTNRTGPAPMLG